jgi:hypothetical protein
MAPPVSRFRAQLGRSAGAVPSWADCVGARRALDAVATSRRPRSAAVRLARLPPTRGGRG